MKQEKKTESANVTNVTSTPNENNNSKKATNIATPIPNLQMKKDQNSVNKMIKEPSPSKSNVSQMKTGYFCYET